MDNQNSVVVVLLAVFAIVTVALGGFIIYDKTNRAKNYSSKAKYSKGNDLVSDQLDIDRYTYTIANREKVQVVAEDISGVIGILIDTKGDAYLFSSANAAALSNNVIKTTVQVLQNQSQKYAPSGFLNSSGSNILESYKLNVEKVLSLYYVHSGSSKRGVFIFLKEDGTLSYLSCDALFNKKIFSVNDINNVNDVVSIVENDYDYNPYAIKLDGTEFSLGNLINVY